MKARRGHSIVRGFAALLLAALAFAVPDPATARGRRKPPPAPAPQPPSPPAANPACPAALTSTEVGTLLTNAAASVSFSNLAIAVVDRPGNVLGVLVQGSPSLAVRDRAVGLARTGAFFSSNQAPLSSRTVRFVSGLHFPPGIRRVSNAALYGIESTNRGCDLNVTWNLGCFLPRATSLNGLPCSTATAAGCGTGPVTGKTVDLSGTPRDIDPLAVDPGGLPIYRGTELVGGIGVAGVPAGQGAAAEFAALSAFGGGLSFVPANLAEPKVVFIDGIRLPFVLQTRRPAGVAAGPAGPGSFAVPPGGGQCAPDGYLVGPLAGSQLTAAEVAGIVSQTAAAAGRTRAVLRLPIGQRTRMVISVGDVDGKVLAIFRMPDAPVFSVDVAVAKARNVAWFSGPGAADLAPDVPSGTAITSRTLSFGAQPLYPPGIDGSGPGPFFDLFAQDVLTPCSEGSKAGPNRNGIVFFPGSVPLYKGGTLVGGLGVSGDGVEQDDYVSFRGAAGFLPPSNRQADTVYARGVRLPFLKFPRNPEQ